MDLRWTGLTMRKEAIRKAIQRITVFCWIGFVLVGVTGCGLQTSVVSGRHSLKDGGCIKINQEAWHPNPQYRITVRATFIHARPLFVRSVGDWSPFHEVTLYFTSMARGLDGPQWTTDIPMDSCLLSDMTYLGTASVHDGQFSWTGTYPSYVRSKHLYSVIVLADQGKYGIWSLPFGWFTGPLRGIPDKP